MDMLRTCVCVLRYEWGKVNCDSVCCGSWVFSCVDPLFANLSLIDAVCLCMYSCGSES